MLRPPFGEFPPKCLRVLRPMEASLLARWSLALNIKTLPAKGQYGLKGKVVTIAHERPKALDAFRDALDETLIVYNEASTARHKWCHFISRRRVREALQWLVARGCGLSPSLRLCQRAPRSLVSASSPARACLVDVALLCGLQHLTSGGALNPDAPSVLVSSLRRGA